nr:hypothetical protein [Tanacetum cinerariifolium]
MNTAGQSWNRHSTLKVDRISHQSLAVGNGSLPLVCLILALSVVMTSLSFRKASIDKVPVLRVQHKTAPSTVPTSLSFLKALVNKVPVLRVQHQAPVDKVPVLRV